MDVRTRRIAALDGIELKDATFHRRSFPPHFHDGWSIGVIRRGMEGLVVRGDALVAHAGCVVVLAPGEVHAHAAFDSEPWRYQVLYLSPGFVEYRRHAIGGGRWLPAVIDDRATYERFARLHVGSEIELDTLVAAIDELLRHATDAGGLETTAVALADAAAYIRVHAADKLTAEAVAARFGMRAQPFVRAFQRQHGLTPASYQMVHRINRARALLAAGTPIADAAIDSGFYDQSHLVRFFKKYTGTTPSEYRGVPG